MTARVEAFLLSCAGGGERYALHHQPAQGVPPYRAFVYLHPSAEEMNKARRMAALQARALAERGVAVLQIDLLGCGDSAGNFGDASWDAWTDDARCAWEWLRGRHDVPVGFWGLRAGCLLAAQAARRIDVPLDFVFWQPVVSGRTHLSQFLRLSSVADLLGSRPSAGASESARDVLASGRSVEIAGYELSPSMADGLARAELRPPAEALHGLWIEVDQRGEGDLTPATRNALQAWRPIHRQVLQSATVIGPAFWQTQEIEDAPELIRATLDGIASWTAA